MKNTRDVLRSDATNGIMVKCDLDHIDRETMLQEEECYSLTPL